MCGIAGIVSLGINNDSGNRRLVQSAISAQSHRGPDSQGFFQNSNVCLGMCRLSIIDIKNGQQPNFNSDRKIVSIFNGEIYNFKELRKLDLPFSSQLQSYGDSALIPYMFERFGPEFVHQLRGQFAIAIADLRAGEFFLYRDRFGEKPLWYQKNDSEVKFASEMRGLLALDIEREIEDNSVCEFLQYGYVNAPRSIFKNVFQVRPAHFLRFSKDEVSEHSYWRPTSVVSRETSFTLAKQEAKQLIMESVELQMVAERDVGIFLSGGIDSSLIASYARKISPKIKTFSIGFFNDEFDESRYSSRVAQSLKTSHFEKKIIADPALILRDISELIDHPFADSSIIPTYLLAKFASEEVTVALGGDGGDEAFGGYSRYRAVQTLNRLNNLLRVSPSNFIGDFAPASTILQRVFRHAKYQDAGIRYNGILSQYSTTEVKKILNEFPTTYRDPNVILWQEVKSKDVLRSMQSMDLVSYLPGDLMYKSDIASMASSLELRSPFLDHNVIEFGLSLPSKFKFYRSINKRILRELLYEEVPRALVDRPKMGFGVPIAEWLRGDLRPLMNDLLLIENSHISRWFDKKLVKLLIKDHLSGNDRSKNIWPLLVLEMWLRRWAIN